jgi:hypothetical protein
MKLRAWTLLVVCPLAVLTFGAGLSAHAADSESVKKLIADPPREFSSAPLWVWNDLLTEQQIIDTMRDLAAQRIKQVFVHPRPGLMTPYLGPDWFRLWKVALGEAERLDMNVWIYDENSYPSGFAGGLVPEAMPEARGRGLVFRESQKAPKWDDTILAVFRMSGQQPENVTTQVRSGTALPDGHPYRIAAVQRAGNSPWHGDRCYVDLLYPGVTEKFLDITLGAYRREMGDQFGKRIPGCFTDEPNIIPAGGLPWTDDLPQQFKQRWGYDLVENIPSLYFEVGDWRRVRHNYSSVLSQLFIERWGKPYADRCAKLGLEMTGHYWEHEWPNCRGVPDNMAMSAWQQRPSIDCLMNQYAEHTHAQFGNVRMVRELNSIANQLGKTRTLCEVYGAGGWDLRFEDMKRQADWLGVLGVNTFDQHLSYVTLRGARKRDHPQSFSYHEPWWGAYKISGAYLERLSVAVSQGRQVNHILLLEPTSTAWMYQGSESRLKALGDSFFQLIMALEAAQIEYDLGCEDVMGRHGSVQGRELKVGQCSYHTVVLPPWTENLESRTWELLNDYVAAGGKVIACTPLASNLAPRRDGVLAPNDAALATWNPRWRRIEAAAVPEVLRTENPASGFTITRQAGDKGILFHMRRQLTDGELLFLVNTSIEFPSAGRFESEAKGIEKWDLETGRIGRYAFEAAATGVRAKFDLPPCGSLLLFLSQAPCPPAAVRNEQSFVMAPMGSVEVHRAEPNVLVLDYVDITAGGETRTNLYFYQANQFAFQKNGMERNPWDSAVQFKDELIRRRFPANSGFEATYRFRLEGRVPTFLALVIERPDLYAITCNGQAVSASPGAWWLDKCFGRIDIAGVAKAGENKVTLKASPFTIYHELEPAYVLGDFALRPADSGFVITRDHPLRLGKWNEQGHPFYSAGVSYVQRYNVGDVPANQYVVTMTNWLGSVAEVRVNGRPAGYIAYPPWQCDVTTEISNGENTVEVMVIGTLKNTLGPHHGKPALGSAWPGMFQRGPIPGPPAGVEYSTVGYGLFEPFQLRQTVSQ